MAKKKEAVKKKAITLVIITKDKTVENAIREAFSDKHEVVIVRTIGAAVRRGYHTFTFADPGVVTAADMIELVKKAGL